MVSCRFSLKPIHWYSEFSRIGAVHGTNGQVWTRKWDAPTEDRNLRSKECEWLVKGEEHFSHQEVDYTDPFTKHALTIYWMVTLNILNMYQFHVAKSFIFQTPISGISFMRFREIRFRRPHLGTSPVWQTSVPPVGQVPAPQVDPSSWAKVAGKNHWYCHANLC